MFDREGNKVIRAFSPHCDANVLHAPGTCRYCDAYSDRQDTRIACGINFTGENDPNKLPCPSRLYFIANRNGRHVKCLDVKFSK